MRMIGFSPSAARQSYETRDIMRTLLLYGTLSVPRNSSDKWSQLCQQIWFGVLQSVSAICVTWIYHQGRGNLPLINIDSKTIYGSFAPGKPFRVGVGVCLYDR